MSEMTEKYKDLQPEKATQIAETLSSQQREGFEAITELNKRLTSTNFFTNGGAAVALLAYMGSGAEFWYVKIAVAFFTFGLIATGIELRSLQQYWRLLTRDAGRRHRGFLSNELTVNDCMVPKEIGKAAHRTNHIAGWVAQGCFIVGVVVCAGGFLARPFNC